MIERVMRWTVTGTHQEKLMGIPPTGNRVEIHGCSVDEIHDGKVVRDYTYWNSAALLRQLGVLPPRGAGVQTEQQAVTAAARGWNLEARQRTPRVSSWL